jgi:hypothetical protein
LIRQPPQSNASSAPPQKPSSLAKQFPLPSLPRYRFLFSSAKQACADLPTDIATWFAKVKTLRGLYNAIRHSPSDTHARTLCHPLSLLTKLADDLNMSASDFELISHHNRTVLKVEWDRALRIT